MDEPAASNPASEGESELLSENNLDHEDDSESSDSEFQLSDEEAFDVNNGSEDEDEVEAAMLSAAIQISLKTPTGEASNVASTSRSPAEKRTRSKNHFASDQEFAELEYSSEEEPLANKNKGKGKKAAKVSQTKSQTREQSRIARQEALAERRDRRIEEYKLRRELGRKLTHVSFFLISLTWKTQTPPIVGWENYLMAI